MSDLERAIRRLERWHKVWEVKNPDRILAPSFATEEEMNHLHELVEEYSGHDGRTYYICLGCQVMWPISQPPSNSVIIGHE